MSLEPLSKSLGTVIDERLSSPLVSSFVIAWSLWNYKIFFILFSSRPLEYKFDGVQDRFSGVDLWINGVGVPTLAALIYIYLLPIPARAVYRQWRENQHKNDEIKAKYDSQKPLSSEEARLYRQKFREFEDEAEKLIAHIQNLRGDLKSANDKITALEAETLNTAKELSESKGVRDRLVQLDEKLGAVTAISERRARWLSELIKAADISDKPFEVEWSALVNATKSKLVQSGVRGQEQIDGVEGLLKPFERYRRNLVSVVSRIENELRLNDLLRPPIEDRSEEEDWEGGRFQTVVRTDLTPSNQSTPP